MTSPIRFLAMLVVVLMVAIACGDDGGEQATATTSSATTTTSVATTSTSQAITTQAESTSPSLTLAVDGIVGSEGMALVATLYTPERYVGSICIMVDDDPWTGGGVFTTAPTTNPCEKEPPYGEVITEEGDFLISLGLYTVGSTTPVMCATAAATIAGPTELTIPADSLVPDC